MTRAELMDEIDASWNELYGYVTSLSEEQLTRPTDAGGWTATDHITNVAMWTRAALAMLEGKSIREVLDIAPEVWELQDNDPINAVMRERYHDMALDQVITTLRQNHDRVLTKLNSMTEADLQLPHHHYQPQSSDERPIIDYIKWYIPDHTRQHIPWITAIVGQA